MKDEWLQTALRLASKKADFYSGARKILRSQVVTFEKISDDLVMADAGYTSAKSSHLRRHYLHEESRETALSLWDRRRSQAKYGSVGFTTYNHFIKGDPNKKSKRASVMGPCIQSVNLTLLPNGQTAVDVFYRTTELFKKFPADLVFLRDELLDGFEMDLESITFYFANVTIHPQYFLTIVPHLDDPIRELEIIAKKDPFFYKWTIKWSARYLCPEHRRGIEKFAQAMRVHKDVNARIAPKVIKKLQKYLRDNHPGFTREYTAPTENEDDDDAD